MKLAITTASSKLSKGIIYIVSGKKHLQRALISATSLKQHMPDIPITIFSSLSVDSPLFDQVIKIEAKELKGQVKGPAHLSPKVDYISESPYDSTIFLDADTFISDSFYELFDLLNNFDMAIAHDTFRTFAYENEFLIGHMRQLPDCYPIFNSGVIAFRKSNEVKNLFCRWKMLYNKYNEIIRSAGGNYFGDQTSLREILYTSNVKLAVLPPEYNCRTNHLVFINLKAKIIHGVFPDLGELEKEVNKKLGNRVFIPKLGLIHESTQSPLCYTKWYYKERLRLFKKKKIVRKVIDGLRYLKRIIIHQKI